MKLFLIFVIVVLVLLVSVADTDPNACPVDDVSFCAEVWPVILATQQFNATCEPPPFATMLPDYSYDYWCNRDFLTPTVDPVDLPDPVITVEPTPFVPSYQNPLYQANPFRFNNPFGG